LEAPRVDFLQGHDIGPVSFDHLDDAIEREPTVGPDTTMNVPRHDPDRGGWSLAAQV
jgi:hypothetical protein